MSCRMNFICTALATARITTDNATMPTTTFDLMLIARRVPTDESVTRSPHGLASGTRRGLRCDEKGERTWHFHRHERPVLNRFRGLPYPRRARA